jgi:hypothetical protein
MIPQNPLPTDRERVEPRASGLDAPFAAEQAPAALADRVVEALQARQLIRSTPIDTEKGEPMSRTLAASFVAAVLGLAAGYFGADARSKASAEPARVATTSTAPAARYALMLFEDASYQSPTDETAQRDRVTEYGDWARSLAARNQLEAGDELASDGWVLEPGGASRVGDIRSEAGTLAGYFVIRAADDAKAAEIARDCPHLRYGGRVLLRRIAT